MTADRTVKVDYLARVEGEGALDLVLRDGQVTEARLRIFEPPRFFEAFLRGKDRADVPDLTSRICGICPIAYQMSSVHALEAAAGVQVGEPIRTLRRLFYCGEWIESHALHIYLLHAPDFLGYESGLSLAADHPEPVKRGLSIKKTGNDLVEAIGGRAIHPVSARLGGFSRPPRKRELLALLPRLERALEDALATVAFAASLPFPDFTADYDFVSLCHPSEYPMNEGEIVSSTGLRVSASDFEKHFVEEHVAHSNALQSRKDGGVYLVGPLARLWLNYDRLHPVALKAARECGIPLPTRNPFVSIVVRAVELVHAVAEAADIVRAYEEPERAWVDVPLRAGTGTAATEAPRGLLYHRYEVGPAGEVLSAKIVPPTAQNQARIETDLREFAPRFLHLPNAELTWKLEQLVRAYDPCISCATHFLKVRLIGGTS
ncbi:MAG: Ni/Fe hydrogenase subunit alpha [Candidatus Wallbacteria bacterium]|nr:Ni/Fe hydrogenase subunit alpha [Candidatus Wallbacteria bacterium]